MSAPADVAAPAAAPAPAARAGRLHLLLQQAGGKHALVLGGFSLAATLLLAVAHVLTRAPIEARALEDLRSSLAQVIPASIHDNNPATDTLQLPQAGAPLRVYRARKDGRVTAVAFETQGRGYAGPIRVLLGIDADGRLLGVRVLQHTETPGLGDKIEVARSDWITRFAGLALGDPPEAQWAVKKDGGRFDQFAGATITPRAVVNSVRDGLKLFAAQRAALLEEAR
jgi:electron transport complex protein RnfG